MCLKYDVCGVCMTYVCAYHVYMHAHMYVCVRVCVHTPVFGACVRAMYMYV